KRDVILRLIARTYFKNYKRPRLMQHIYTAMSGLLAPLLNNKEATIDDFVERASGFITRTENLRKLTPEYKAIALAHMYIVWDDLDQYLDYEVDEDEYYAIATELLKLLIYGYLNVADS